jgi:hypothetical protein
MINNILSPKRIVFVLTLISIYLFLFASVTQSEEPELKEEFVYELYLWNGKTYNYTFCPYEIDDIYIIAEKPSVFTLKKTDVYYWPITNEYRANWFEKNELLEGTLQIMQGDKVIDEYEITKYCFQQPSGTYTDEKILLTGEEAQEVYNGYKKTKDNYEGLVKNYYEKVEEYEEIMNELAEEKRGEIKRSDIPEYPEYPVAPREFVTEPKMAFILNVEEGIYKVRFRDKDDNVVSNTEKRLIVFGERREGITYKILNEEKWTYPELSNEKEDILYIKGKQTVFLQPFTAVEYPEKGYNKLTKLNNINTEELSQRNWQWIQLNKQSGVTVQLIKDDNVVEEINEKPYYVKQLPGYVLGYEIIEYDENMDKKPSFWAYKLDLKMIEKGYKIRLVDSKGDVLSGSGRKIRSVKGYNIVYLFIFSFIPLVCGLIVYIKTRKKK